MSMQDNIKKVSVLGKIDKEKPQAANILKALNVNIAFVYIGSKTDDPYSFKLIFSEEENNKEHRQISIIKFDDFSNEELQQAFKTFEPRTKAGHIVLESLVPLMFQNG